MLDICLLGTGGMMPMPSRFLTAMLARLNGRLALIDCGEGTQVTMKMLGWGFKAIDVICITHFHADHISGLPGLVVPQQLLSGLPCGVQLIGKPFGEEELFRAGAAIETERMLPELKGGC